jgi:hypothetical protein
MRGNGGTVRLRISGDASVNEDCEGGLITRTSTIFRAIRARPGALAVVSLAAVLTVPIQAPNAQAQPGTRKVVLIVDENAPFTKIVDKASAPYMNALVSQGVLFTDYHAITTGSAKDYRAMSSGRTDQVTPPSDNIYEALDTSDIPWTSFQESMVDNCGAGSSGTVPGTSVPLYTPGHDASHMFRANDACATNDVPLVSDTQLQTLPDFSVIIPNECDDMHTFPTGDQEFPSGTCPSYFGPVSGENKREIGDAWLQHVVPLLLADPTVTVLITFDEGGRANAQHVYTVEVGGVAAGTTDATTYDHYGLLAGLYDAFALGTAPNSAATAVPLPIPTE